MNPNLDRLQPYPFARLKGLLSGITPNQSLEPLRLSIGEPEHKPPAFVGEILADGNKYLNRYPPTSGSSELRSAIAKWATRRFNLGNGSLDPEKMIVPCNGTREALFAIVQAVVNTDADQPLVLMPNPFYQIYEGAAILAGAKPQRINNNPVTQLPDFDSITEDQWRHCQLLFICTPGNPSGVAIEMDTLKKLIRLAHEYDFLIVSDECYTELYLDETSPVAGLLEASEAMGNPDYKHCLAFHSLSKRSNLAGLRSGFVAGDPDVIAPFLLYRTYHGSAMSLQNQAASAAAWNDDEHVVENRALYRTKYEVLCPEISKVFDYRMPDAGFYLWLKTPGDDIKFAASLYEQQHLTVLPGSFLSRDTHNGNPGSGYIRLALVSPLEDCQRAVKRLVEHANQIIQTI